MQLIDDECEGTLSIAANREFEQLFEYDDAGSVSKLTYPACLTGDCTNTFAVPDVLMTRQR